MSWSPQQIAARLFALADAIDFPYGLDAPDWVRLRAEALRDIAEALDGYHAILPTKD